MKHHPEQQEDEIYMGIIDSHTFFSSSFQIWNTWTNKRLGYGFTENRMRLVNDWRPWFIKRKDVEQEIIRIQQYETHNKEERISLFQKMLDNGTALF